MSSAPSTEVEDSVSALARPPADEIELNLVRGVDAHPIAAPRKVELDNPAMLRDERRRSRLAVKFRDEQVEL